MAQIADIWIGIPDKIEFIQIIIFALMLCHVKLTVQDPRACLFFLEIFCLYLCMWPISEWHFRSTAAQHRYRIRKVYPNQYTQINATKRWNQRAFTSLVEPTHVPGWMCLCSFLLVWARQTHVWLSETLEAALLHQVVSQQLQSGTLMSIALSIHIKRGPVLSPLLAQTLDIFEQSILHKFSWQKIETMLSYATFHTDQSKYWTSTESRHSIKGNWSYWK